MHVYQLPGEIAEIHDEIVKAVNNGATPGETLVRECIKRVAQRQNNNQHAVFVFYNEYEDMKGDAWVRCFWCGRLLTDGESRVNGCGKHCLHEHGPVPNRDINNIPELYRQYCNFARRTGFTPMPFSVWLPKEDFTKKRWNEIQVMIELKAEA